MGKLRYYYELLKEDVGRFRYPPTGIRKYTLNIFKLNQIKKLLRNSNKLHLGCGNTKIPGFINIDAFKTQATDFICEIECIISDPFKEKIKIMSRYRFALCFENCVFPGYVTEKIFDCFFAGCIPVYYGAPDIADFVPAETFIDFRWFQGLAELERYLNEIGDAEAQRYLDTARDFLASTAFDKFHQDTFVSELLDIIEKVFETIA